MAKVKTRTEKLEVTGAVVEADINTVPGARGIVVFVHGSGSSRRSPRNQFVADVLGERVLDTVLMDLLTPDEERADELTGHLRFDIEFLTRRVSRVVEAIREDSKLPIGLFGASTGAGAALVTAARRPADVGAVVSRGGRPDLAGAALSSVAAPTLLIVGGNDREVLELNRQAMARMATTVRLEVVPGASHLFEESGTLGQAANLAAEWFVRHLKGE